MCNIWAYFFQKFLHRLDLITLFFEQLDKAFVADEVADADGKEGRFF